MALVRRGISGISALALVMAQIAPVWAQQGQSTLLRANSGASTEFSRQDYQNCQTTEEMAFRKAIRTITLKALQAGTADLDYDAIVTDQWRAGGLDTIVDQRVDIAVAQVREETAWSDLLKSLAYRKQAQELARATAERAYRSEAMKSALEELANNVGREIGRAIVLTTADAALPAQRCLTAYLGPRYGSTVARSVNQDASAAFQIDPKANQAQVSSGRVLLETSSGITGAVLLLVRRQMARMAQRIGQRMIGSILGRLVSVVAGGVGIVLIAKEFWELRHGVLPIVGTEMKSSGSKAKVREELAKSIKEQINGHLDELASRTADKIVDIWHDFRRAHAKVVQLAEQDAAFKTFLDAARPAQLPRLDEIVAIVLKQEGEGAIPKRLNDGTLHIALNKMPEAGMQIAREQQSLPQALAWTALAGDKLDKVIALDIHKRAKPDELSKASLARILALDDRLAITRVASITREARDVLLELDSAKLINLSRSLTEAELNTLSGYLTGLGSDASQRVLRVVAGSPARMRSLSSARVRDAILASRDQTAAVGMMLSETPLLDVMTILRHTQLVWEGQVSPILIWEKHPAIVVAAGFIALFFLMMLRSLLFGRRRRRGKAAATS
ncbi:MAG: hypothetical protein ACR2PI_19465 [Hyphomicrobiaceae bacterium]